MNFKDFQAKALRTANVDNKKDLLRNGVIGIFGECGEISDILKKAMYQGHVLDKEKLLDECSDVCWYVAITAHAIDVDLKFNFIKRLEARSYIEIILDLMRINGTISETMTSENAYMDQHLLNILSCIDELARDLGSSLEEVYQINVKKLEKRYPEGFDSKKSINRPDEIPEGLNKMPEVEEEVNSIGDRCWYCGGQLCWGSDFNYDEVYPIYEDDEDSDEFGGGIVSMLTCSSCGAEVEYSLKDEGYEYNDPEREERATAGVSKEREHTLILKQLHDVYVAKNKDYGDSFAKLRARYPDSILIRLFDKIYRLESIMESDVQLVSDETIEDTLIDMANYSIMEIMFLREQNNKNDK